MYQSYSYNVPLNSRNMYQQNRNDDRIFGGFAVPFLLGGLAGSAWSSRPNSFYATPVFYTNPWNNPWNNQWNNPWNNPWNNTWNNNFYY